MNTTPPKIKIIVGATAVGKTAWAIDYALENNCEIISADSMQIYKKMDAGTAKPSLEDRARVRHHLIDIIDPSEDFSLHNFLTGVDTSIREIKNKGKEPLIVGGTGLYINAFIREFTMPALPKNEELREQLKNRAGAEGTDVLYAELKQIDPLSCEKIMPADLYRIVRALEVFTLTGTPLSAFHQTEKKYRTDAELWLIQKSREQIYSSIEIRVDHMIKNGLIDEVRSLLDQGYSRDLPSMQALGYKESVAYLDGILTKEMCISEIKKRTRNFAKRQLTWFRSFPIAKVIDF